MSKELGELVVTECRPEEFEGKCDVVFSGLDSDIAGETGSVPYEHMARTAMLTAPHRKGLRLSRPPHLLQRQKLPPRPSRSPRSPHRQPLPPLPHPPPTKTMVLQTPRLPSLQLKLRRHRPRHPLRGSPGPLRPHHAMQRRDPASRQRRRLPGRE